MKKFIQRVQDLSQKAAHLKQVVEAAPGQAAQLRDTVLMTAGQIQQMRHDVQSSVMGLRADNEGLLAAALRDINDHADTFSEAGYELTGVDMELSPMHRLIVHLAKTGTADESVIRQLLADSSGNQTVYALLNALAKADAMSERIRLSCLHYRGLVIHVGPTPSVRLCWEAEAEETAALPAAAVQVPPHAPPPLPSEFSQSSFFEQRTPIVTARTAADPTPPQAGAAPALPQPGPATRPASSIAPSGGDWKASALDRFKKMPDVSKYRR